MKFYVSVEMFPATVGLGTALVGTMQHGLRMVAPAPAVVLSTAARVVGGVVSVGVERVQHGHGDGTVSVGVRLTSSLMIVKHIVRNTHSMKILLMSV